MSKQILSHPNPKRNTLTDAFIHAFATPSSRSQQIEHSEQVIKDCKQAVEQMHWQAELIQLHQTAIRIFNQNGGVNRDN